MELGFILNAKTLWTDNGPEKQISGVENNKAAPEAFISEIGWKTRDVVVSGDNRNEYEAMDVEKSSDSCSTATEDNDRHATSMATIPYGVLKLPPGHHLLPEFTLNNQCGDNSEELSEIMLGSSWAGSSNEKITNSLVRS